MCDGKVVGDEAKGEMGQNCVMLEMKKEARKRGQGPHRLPSTRNVQAPG